MGRAGVPTPPADWGRWEQPGDQTLSSAPSTALLKELGVRWCLACTHTLHIFHLCTGTPQEDALTQGFGVGDRFVVVLW